MGRPVVDSNIVIDYLLGHAPAVGLLKRLDEASISIVTWIEVMSGGPPEDEEVTRQFLGRFELLPLTADIAAEAAALRRVRRLKLPDAIIWATARIEGGTLVTRNTKDFPAGDPDVLVPYRL
ncbi:type II toxin-antitoxin system VapC family toxin [Phenylobacterium sp.]|uniref:type II toxin-antitoxin system VapC family toxin n=1 Tax=Phenylobacterium sp. TaxID=1871053 RepID=UPI003919D5DA